MTREPIHEPAAAPSRGAGGWARGNPDLVVIAAWALVITAFGFGRTDYTGDGVRHLAAIVDGTAPRLGEPRWIFFPALMYLLLRPFVALGLVGSVEGLLRPMLVITLALAVGYLLAVRRVLLTLGAPPARRAAALALAGSLSALFMVASDLMEPIFGATLALWGLAYAARQARVAGDAAGRRRAVLVAVGCIAVASFFYQGLILGLAIIPAVVPRDVWWDRRTLIPCAVIVALVPTVVIGTLMVSGNSLRHAFERFAQGEENPLYRGYLKKSGLSAYLVALFTGPPQGVLSSPPSFHGWRGVFGALRDPAARRGAVEMLLRTGFGVGFLAAGCLAAARRRDGWLLLAFASLLLLPLVRRQQAGYLKYYIFLPLLVALAAAHARAGLVAALAGVLLLANGVPLALGLRVMRATYAERGPVYDQAGAQSCWFTTAWAPPFGFRWRGKVCPILGSLAGGSGESPAAVIAAAHGALDHCLRDCFCGSSAVLTDDMTEAGAGAVAQTVEAFAYRDFDLARLVIPAARARQLTSVASGPVYAYPPAEQQRLCGEVTRGLASAP